VLVLIEQSGNTIPGNFAATVFSNSVHYTKLNRRPPAEADLAAYFQISAASVHQMVMTLTKRGFIERSPGQARSIKLLLTRDVLPDLR
jgi:hypothetical protein